MNPRVLPGLLVSLSLVSVSPACGPFFPDTVLDHPRASLDTPPVSYLAELHRLAETSPPPPDTNEVFDENAVSGFLAQLPLEEAELRLAWRTAGVAPAEIERRQLHYEKVRKSLLSGIAGATFMGFEIAPGSIGELPERPLGAEFPTDVADYVEAARLNALGRHDDARALWKDILGRPAESKRFRGVWAAWMLAKTSTDPAECGKWYERAEWEASQGGLDILKLATAAKAWRGPRSEDPVAGLRLSYEAFSSGRDVTAPDIRRISREILSNKNPEVLARAAADPIARQLLNLELQATLDGPTYAGELDDYPRDTPEWPPVEWLGALESKAPLPLEEGARVAWALYGGGRYEEARHWLEISAQDDPLAHWLHAKFDLRSGNLDAANQHLATAIRLSSTRPDWKPGNPYLETLWIHALEERRSASQGRLMADAGIVALAREDYTASLESLRHADYDEDAAYLAEWVLSADELIKHVRSVAPEWEKRNAPIGDNDYYATEDSATVDPATCLDGPALENWSWHITINNRLRYQLGRRLAREDRLDESREFLPPVLVPLFDHYRSLQTARTSGEYSGEALAAITWRQARIHRHWGAELFSTDSTPDGGIRGWSFEVSKLNDMRARREGWVERWDEEALIVSAELEKDRAVPVVALGEVQRVQQHPLPDTHRFHYRFVAAKLAAKAAETLPDNHPQLASLYNTAGLWIADRDPQAADPLYQALVKRCKETEDGKRADVQRWFLRDLDSLVELQCMPAGLIPIPRAE